MYLKLDQYFIAPFSKTTVQLFNGTYERSENVIDRDRMIDVSVVLNGQLIHPSENSWFERDSITFLNLETKEPGNYVVGVSTKARIIEMDAQAFNDYLKHDGVLDMLAKREAEGTLESPAKELYSKHVKTIIQVGDSFSEDWKMNLGYPIEFIPLENPYEIHPGHKLPVQLLYNQEPLINQLVYVGNKSQGITHTHDGDTHSHDSNESHEHTDLVSYRTNDQGVIEIDINSEGVWYLRTIYLQEVNQDDFTHESNWATLTFAIGEEHSHAHADQEHHHEESIPTTVFVIVSLVLITALFFWFKRKK
jgi:uncharacterized GH25 family protein